MNYTRKCPRCTKDIVYDNYGSYRACNSNGSNCRECGLEIRKENNAKRDKLLMDKSGFIFRPREDLQGK
jgi:hypothetical protein